MGERRECSEGELAVGIGLSWVNGWNGREAWVDLEDKAAWTDIMRKGIAGSLCDRGARAGRVR